MKACRLIRLAAACLCGAASAYPAGSPQADPDLRIDVQRVVVRVIAQEKQSHRPIDGLTATDFQLKSDGVKRALSYFGHGTDSTRRLGLVLLLDTRMLHRENLESLAQTAQAALQRLGPADQVAIWRMDQAHSEELLPPTTDRNMVVDHLMTFSQEVSRSPQFGSGPLPALHAIVEAQGQFAAGCELAIVAITNDLDAESRTKVEALRTMLLRHDVTLHLLYRAGTTDRALRKLSQAVAPGGFAPTVPWLHYQALSYLAKESGGEFVPVEREDYGAAFLKVIGDIGASYVLEFRRPETTSAHPFHPLSIAVKTPQRGTLRLFYRKGYLDAGN